MNKTFNLVLVIILSSLSEVCISQTNTVDTIEIYRKFHELEGLNDNSLIDAFNKHQSKSSFIKRFSSEFIELGDMEVENDSIVEAIDKFKNEVFLLKSQKGFDHIVSDDKKISIISWNTLMGGTMADYRAVIVYKTLEGVKIMDVKEGFIRYDKIVTFRVNESNILYLGLGKGRASSILTLRSLKLFKIEKDTLSLPKLFPEQENEISVAINLARFKESEKVPEITVKEKGKVLLIPVTDEDDKFKGRYKKLIFNGLNYEESVK